MKKMKNKTASKAAKIIYDVHLDIEKHIKNTKQLRLFYFSMIWAVRGSGLLTSKE